MMKEKLEALGFKQTKVGSKGRSNRNPSNPNSNIKPIVNTVGSRTMIVLDLEATCESRDEPNPKMPRHEMEIIEIGAVALVDGEIVEEFQIFVKPVIHPVLTDFCTQLTTIKQSDVDDAPEFTEAMAAFGEWVLSVKDKYGIKLWGSWGDYDLKQFYRNRKLLDIRELSEIERVYHVNISEAYRIHRGNKKKSGMGKAIRESRLEIHGTHHRALDDALSIVKIINANNMLFS